MAPTADITGAKLPPARARLASAHTASHSDSPCLSVLLYQKPAPHLGETHSMSTGDMTTAATTRGAYGPRYPNNLYLPNSPIDDASEGLVRQGGVVDVRLTGEAMQ